jgi:molybdate transport system permease protein
VTADAWHAVVFTVGIAALSTLLTFPFGVGLAWLMARRNWRGKSIVETIVMLPLFIPPVATGLILLLLFSRRGLIGSFLQRAFGIEIIFTWRAVLIASAVMSFPLLVRTAQSAFEDVSGRFEDIARTLGANEWRVFTSISFPLALRGVIAGTVLTFARAVGEFGATAIVAGMIPRKTMTISLLIYQNIQLGHDRDALPLLGVSIALVFFAILGSQLFAGRRRVL